MDTKEVEAGKKYVFELLAVAGGDEFAVFETPTGCPVIVPQEEAEALYPVKGSLGTTPAPKYDPCREFRAGDKVELKTNLGRKPYDTFDGKEYIPDGTVFTVLRDEWTGGKVDIFEKDESDAFTVHFSNLQLVTPVEEMEPYIVRIVEAEGETEWHVEPRNNKLAFVAIYGDAHPYPKAAAEAERDRLNAEYRKEVDNG